MRKGGSGGPAGEERGTKKRSWPRFSLRRLLHPSPLLARRLLNVAAPPPPCLQTPPSHPTSTNGESPVDSTKVSLEPRLHDDSVSNKTSASSGNARSDGLIECSLCLNELEPHYFPQLLTCSHRSCYDCFQVYLRIEISESRVSITCPQCSEPMHPNDIRMILNDKSQYEKYEDFMVRRVLAVDPDTRWCPAPDCSYAVIAAGCASCPKIKCERPGCGSYFCYHCKAPWHPNQTCDAARAQRSPNVRSSSLSFSQDSQHKDLKRCPRCQVLIVKMDDGSCNHMTCAVCGAEFCWLCMKEISDLHYLSPSGCTFWGKKPWSRKKKILWQLGTLVGAPVGIGLVAGIAVPAIIIGIPVWVGRKLYTRYEHANKHKRNLAIAGGVSASVLISPILASLAVGIGVPILLFYVYGVVPVSLCRSGGCGVSTSGTGVRFDFDDEGDMIGVLATKSNDGDTVSHPGGNPSIGEASLSLGSGSQLEREADRESASFVALAGSIASNTIAQRLEVLADVVASQRFSVSSETASATTSLSDKSVADDGGASTRGLAGSMLNFKMDAGSLSNYRGASNDSSTANEAVGGLASAETASQWSEPMSVSSLEELNSGVSRKSARKNKHIHKEDSEDVSSERVRFDSHVSYIDPNVHMKHSSRMPHLSENEPSTSKQDLVIEIQRLGDTLSMSSEKSQGDDSSFKGNFKADDSNSLTETGSQSVSSLDEVYSGLLKKTAVRKTKTLHKEDVEEGIGDRVRFDNHVSYIDDDCEVMPSIHRKTPHTIPEDAPSSSNKSTSSLRSLFFQGETSSQSRGSESPNLPSIPEPVSVECVAIDMPPQ
uniref:RBR-type E3 ubiquitin transferase n=2 Tax=Lygus hesperus TaxID=30085 RepID=A0A0A9XD62_LYGHE